MIQFTQSIKLKDWTFLYKKKKKKKKRTVIYRFIRCRIELNIYMYTHIYIYIKTGSDYSGRLFDGQFCDANGKAINHGIFKINVRIK